MKCITYFSLICIILGFSCNTKEEILDFSSLAKEELIYHRSISLQEILNEAVENENADSLFINSLILNFIEKDGILINKLNSSIFEESNFHQVLGVNDIYNMILNVENSLKFSWKNLVIQIGFDLLVSYILFISFLFLITLPFDYKNFSALRAVINQSKYVIVVSLIISFYFSPAEIIEIVPSSKENEITKEINVVNEKIALK